MKNKKIKIIFIGVSSFAVPALEALIKEKYSIIAVITSPDKPSGRKKEVFFSPVKKLAQEHNLNISQPDNISETKERIRQLKPDLIIVSSYGKIIPKEILNIPQFKSINIHPSLLPKYRGPSPIQTAILNGDKKTGITVIIMDEKMDHGPVIFQKELEILPDENYKELEKRLSQESGKILIKIIPEYIKKELIPQKQNEEKATYTKIILKEEGEIDFNKTAREIERKIRAFYPWPGTFFFLNKKRVKIIKGKAVNKKEKASLKTGQGCLELELVQPEGKKIMTGQEFFRGYSNQLDLEKFI